MARKPWKRLTINLSGEDYLSLRQVASFYDQSMGEFVRSLVADSLQSNKKLLQLYASCLNETKPSEPLS